MKKLFKEDDLNLTNFLLLKALRERSWSQSQLVKVAKLSSEARLSRIIRGWQCPNEKEVIAISKALKIKRSLLGFSKN